MSLVYKTLFEIKLAHEYYHTASDGETIFALNSQVERLNFLQKEFSAGHISILQDLDFAFPKSLEQFYGGQGLKIIPAYSGIKVVVRVNTIIRSDNYVVFTPTNSIPENIIININRKNNAFTSYTQGRVRNSISAKYFFSNDNINGIKSFPYITNPISDFNSTANYEQGELASFGLSAIKEFYLTGTGPMWNQVKGTAFANPNDLLLFPRKINYLINTTGLPDITIDLTDAAGTSIRQISASGDSLEKVSVDLSQLPELTDNIDENLADKLYTLNITSSSGFKQQLPAIFSDELTLPDSIGIVHIAKSPENTEFNLLGDDGHLIRRKDPSGVWIDAPVFELPFKGRSAFWKYRNDKGHNIVFSPDLTGYVSSEDGFLITTRPLPVSRYHFVMHKEGSTDTRYLPNPEELRLVKDSKGRLCYDVLVADSKTFPT